MAVTVKDYMDKILEVKRQIPTEIGKIIERNEQKILDLNRKLQLFDKGENVFGKVVGVYKHDRNRSLFSDPIGYPKRVGEHINFYDTNEFYRKFTYEYSNNRLTIYSEDSKAPMLEARYGDIFGLNAENQATLNDKIIQPELWEFISTYL